LFVWRAGCSNSIVLGLWFFFDLESWLQQSNCCVVGWVLCLFWRAGYSSTILLWDSFCLFWRARCSKEILLSGGFCLFLNRKKKTDSKKK
jgi:hypothetical protein